MWAQRQRVDQASVKRRTSRDGSGSGSGAGRASEVLSPGERMQR